MSKSVFALSIMLVYAAGCATSETPATQDAAATVIPASSQAAAVVPGLTSWQIHPVGDAIEVTGVDSQGHVLTRSTIRGTTIDSAGTRRVEIATDSATLQMTARGDQILDRQMTGQPSAATSQLVRDLRGYDGVQPYGCWIAGATAALLCTAATLEDGLNLIADADCISALADYANCLAT
jgi:hypothetical protein